MTEKTGTEIMMGSFAATRLEAASAQAASALPPGARTLYRDGFEAGARWAMEEIQRHFVLQPRETL